MNSRMDIADYQALYLLGLARLTSLRSTRTVQVGSQQLEALPLGEIEAWILRVDRREFEGEDGEKNLSNIEWLSPRVMAHQMVTEQLSSHMPFLPMRFGTLFSNTERLQEFLDVNQDAVASFLECEGTMQEWGIKCRVDWTRAVEAYRQETNGDEDQAPVGAGMNYLLKKKMVRDRDEAVRSWLRAKVESVQNRIRKMGKGWVERRPGHSDISKTANVDIVANWSLLIEPEELPQLETLINELTEANDYGLYWQHTGPWPPYSFVPALISPHENNEASTYC